MSSKTTIRPASKVIFFPFPHFYVDWINAENCYTFQTYSSTTEEEFRFKIFRQNWKRIIKHNRLAMDGQFTYFLKINMHTDKLSHEVAEMMNGFRPDLKQVATEMIIPLHSL